MLTDTLLVVGIVVDKVLMTEVVAVLVVVVVEVQTKMRRVELSKRPWQARVMGCSWRWASDFASGSI